MVKKNSVTLHAAITNEKNDREFDDLDRLLEEIFGEKPHNTVNSDSGRQPSVDASHGA
ncbi:MAG TPA: hypothetical protein VFE75_13160 [Rhodanobacter sp.]|nr:hypothetical protein [Rhodanobacter sp.]